MAKDTDLADRNGLALVSEGKPPELRVVREALYAHGRGGFDKRDDLLALLRELRWLLRPSAGLLVKVTDESLKKDYRVERREMGQHDALPVSLPRPRYECA